MFRGLHAIFACTNPKCIGRQDSPHQDATLGKLFAEPRITCDACDSRVFELASCRYCGSSYVIGYTDEVPSTLSFLWAETEGDLEKVELLTAAPRYQNMTEEVRIHLRTGYIDRDNSFPDDEVRSFWLFLNTSGNREFTFERCATCQPSSSRMKSRISRFQNKGRTALYRR